MKIAVVGRGNVGGGLADLWEGVGYEVSRIGRESGDVSEASPRADAPIRPTRGCSGSTTRPRWSNWPAWGSG
jgi:predicted dinucleotide-binding enzyme